MTLRRNGKPRYRRAKSQKPDTTIAIIYVPILPRLPHYAWRKAQ